MSYRVNEFVSESFTNDLGQTLNPGDSVVAVTTGYGHTVRVITGKFEGVYRSHKGQLTGTRIGDVPVKSQVREYVEDGAHEETRWDYSVRKFVPTGKRYNLVPKLRYRKSSLQRNRVFKIETSLKEVTI